MLYRCCRLSLTILAVFLALLTISCNKSNPVTPGKQQLTISENPVTVALNSPRTIFVSGGTGPCSVKSISDSSVVSASIVSYSSLIGNYLTLTGRKTGSAAIVLQDSARTAEAEVTVTVAEMAASPSGVTVQVGRTANVTIQGGSYPYAIDQNTNAAVATVTFTDYSFNILGVAPGSTSLVVKDNASPARKVTISITVIPRVTFTTPGKMSFSSTVGDFAANGIMVDDINNLPTLPANSEGAGGTFLSIYAPTDNSIYTPTINLVAIVGFKKHSQNIADVAAVIFTKSSLDRGVLVIASSQSSGPDTALVEFVLNGDLNSQTADTYLLSTGTLILTTLSTQKTTGTFSGSAILLRNNIPVAGSSATVTGGAFDVPLLADYGGYRAPSFADPRMSAFAKKMVDGMITKMKRSQ